MPSLFMSTQGKVPYFSTDTLKMHPDFLNVLSFQWLNLDYIYISVEYHSLLP